MNKSLVIVALLCMISFIIQLLTVISVPITGHSIDYNLSFAVYNDIAFGVFGVCNMRLHLCSDASIGYPSGDQIFNNYTFDESGYGGMELPSNARFSISKLLVVHVIAFCFTALLLLSSVAVLLRQWAYENRKLLRQFQELFKSKSQSVEDSSDSESFKQITNTDTSGNASSDTRIGRSSVLELFQILEDEDVDGNVENLNQSQRYSRQYSHDEEQQFDDDNDDNDNDDEEDINDDKKPNLMPYLTVQLALALLSCLLNLLGLLSDVLLFMPHLTYLGWIQFIPIICLGVMAAFVCFIRRSISSRQYLEEEYFYANDDMRTKRNIVVHSDDDSQSDDGFYVYTNGFYSNYADRSEHNPSQQSNTNSWTRHTPRADNDTPIADNDVPRTDTPNEEEEEEEDISVNSSQMSRSIPLRDLNRL